MIHKYKIQVIQYKTKNNMIKFNFIRQFPSLPLIADFPDIVCQTFSTGSMKGNSKSSHISGCCYSNGVLNGGPRLKPPVGRALVAPRRAVPCGAAQVCSMWRGVGPYGPTTFCRTLSCSL